MRVLLSGGETGGSMMPLLAVAEELKKRDPKAELLFLGTGKGFEREIVKDYNINYSSIVSGKLRRYFSLRNFIDPFLILVGFVQSIFKILKFKPDVVLTAGGFIGVPVVWAAWLLRKPVIIHQQDIRKSLSNKLTTSFAKRITVTFKKSLKDFPSNKTVWIGNPIRGEILTGDRKRGKNIFNLEENLPTVLVLGGGTGALSLNKVIISALPKFLEFCQVIHLTGKEKSVDEKLRAQNLNLGSRYHSYEFLKDELKEAYAASDLIISRAGLSTLSELSLLGKPTILVPLPDTHQEENARYFAGNQAVKLVQQSNLNTEELVQLVRGLLQNREERNKLSKHISRIMKKDARKKMAEEIMRVKKR